MCDFKDITGHNDILRVLKGALASKRISHAYLFAGPGGVGKTTVASIFAGVLLCFHPHPGGACGECRSCKQFRSGNHPDFHHLGPDGAAIKISRIRQLQKEVSLQPYQGGRQVYVIQDADTMTKEAANSFLKILEEPPDGVVFILISDFPQYLPATISSRCQQINFRPLSNQEIALGLYRLKGISEKDSRLPVALSGGRLGQALELVENNGERDKLFILLEQLDNATPSELCLLAGEWTGQEVDWQRVMDMLLLWYRDLLIWKNGRKDLIVNCDRVDIIDLEVKKFSMHKVIQNMKAVEKARIELKTRVNTRLVLEKLFFSLTGI